MRHLNFQKISLEFIQVCGILNHAKEIHSQAYGNRLLHGGNQGGGGGLGGRYNEFTANISGGCENLIEIGKIGVKVF